MPGHAYLLGDIYLISENYDEDCQMIRQDSICALVAADIKAVHLGESLLWQGSWKAEKNQVKNDCATFARLLVAFGT